jgi:hypothetical protein
VGPDDLDQEVDLLARLLVGHHRDDAVALQAGRDRQARADVARRRLDDRSARPQAAVAFGGLMSATATRSLTDPPGLSDSTFATTAGVRPAPSRDRRTSGVRPIASRIESSMRGCGSARWRVSHCTPVARDSDVLGTPLR